MYGGLIPDGDIKQQLRTIRTIQAIGTGLIQSLIALALFFAVGNEISRSRRKLGQGNADLAEAIQKMEQMAITDELTGLINRRQMMFVLGQQKAVAGIASNLKHGDFLSPKRPGW